MVDTNNRGALNRDELRNLLCLIALIQQNRPLNLDQLRSTGGPCPVFHIIARACRVARSPADRCRPLLSVSTEVPVPRFPGLDGTPETAAASAPAAQPAAPAYTAPAASAPAYSAAPAPVAQQSWAPAPVPATNAYVPSPQAAAGRSALLYVHSRPHPRPPTAPPNPTRPSFLADYRPPPSPAPCPHPHFLTHSAVLLSLRAHSAPSTQIVFQQMADREAVDVKVSERVGNGKFFGGKTVYYDVSSKVGAPACRPPSHRLRPG